MELYLMRTTFITFPNTLCKFKNKSGTEFMFGKNLFGECIFTISLLTCLFLLTERFATIIEFSAFRSSR